MNILLQKNYTEIPINKAEILRYAGCKNDCELPLVDECLSEVKDKLFYKICYRFFDVKFTENEIDLGFAKTNSESLRRNLDGCEKIILFSATIGIEIDRLIKKYNKISPSRALVFQAIGAERVESLCNSFNEEMSEEFLLKPRFSPGYGDLSLDIQKDIFNVLECPKNIGVTLNDSLLMSPSKSVTAIIGIQGRK